MPTTSDRIVTQRVTDALHRDRSLRSEAAGIRISTDGGTVTLDGLVSCVEAKERARETARPVAGVVRVEDRLLVRGDGILD